MIKRQTTKGEFTISRLRRLFQLLAQPKKEEEDDWIIANRIDKQNWLKCGCFSKSYVKVVSLHPASVPALGVVRLSLPAHHGEHDDERGRARGRKENRRQRRCRRRCSGQSVSLKRLKQQHLLCV